MLETFPKIDDAPPPFTERPDVDDIDNPDTTRKPVPDVLYKCRSYSLLKKRDTTQGQEFSINCQFDLDKIQ